MKISFNKTIAPKSILGKIVVAVIIIAGIYFIITILTFGVIILGILVLVWGIIERFKKKPNSKHVVVVKGKIEKEPTADKRFLETNIPATKLCNGFRRNDQGDEPLTIRCATPIYQCRRCGQSGCNMPDCSEVGFEQGFCLRCKTRLLLKTS